MRILITGAKGYVGARICADLKSDFEVYGVYHKAGSAGLLKGDITNRASIESVVDKVKPELIIHTAALVSQRSCEKNPKLAYDVNVRGTENVALGAKRMGAKLVHISTGAVLNLEQNGVYGKTKLEAEKVLANAYDKYVILRAGMIIGSSAGARGDSFQNQLVGNIVEKTLPVYDDGYRYQITWIGYLSEIITKIVEKDLNGETLPTVTADNMTKFEIARGILKEFGIEAVAKKEMGPMKRKFQTVDKLQELGLPIYTCQDVIDKTVRDMRDWLEHGKQS